MKKTTVKLEFKDAQVSWTMDKEYDNSRKIAMSKASVVISVFDKYGNEQKIKILGILKQFNFNMALPELPLDEVTCHETSV